MVDEQYPGTSKPGSGGYPQQQVRQQRYPAYPSGTPQQSTQQNISPQEVSRIGLTPRVREPASDAGSSAGQGPSSDRPGIFDSRFIIPLVAIIIVIIVVFFVVSFITGKGSESGTSGEGSADYSCYADTGDSGESESAGIRESSGVLVSESGPGDGSGEESAAIPDGLIDLLEADLKDCNGIDISDDQYARDGCLLDLSISHADAFYCPYIKRLSGEVSQDSCYEGIAVLYGEVDICDNMIAFDENYSYSSCVFNVAVETEDPWLCHRIPAEAEVYSYDECALATG